MAALILSGHGLLLKACCQVGGKVPEKLKCIFADSGIDYATAKELIRYPMVLEEAGVGVIIER